MKKIAIFQYDLGVGGIQKSLINLLNNIDLKNYNIDLYLFSKENFYDIQIPKEVNVIYLPPFPAIYKIVPFILIKKIKKFSIIKKYDITIDFNGYSNECAVAALKTESSKKIIWCHNDIILKYKNEWKYRILFGAFKSKYKYFDNIVTVSEGAKKAFMKKMKVVSQKVISIPNYIDTKEIFEKSKEKVEFEVDKKKYNLVSVGRICHQKGFDILVNIMGQVVKQNKDINLYIIGNGPDFTKIKKKIERKNLENNIFLLGNKNNPFKYMKKMDGFILTSRYEGQGMVILEAKCLGLSIFIPKHLENYVEDVKAMDNIIESILKATKKEKQQDDLQKYNRKIRNKIEILLQD